MQDESDFNTVKSAMGRRVAVSRMTAPTTDTSPADDYDIVLESELILECFQLILKLQCESLIVQFGVSRRLMTVVGRFWFAYIKWWQSNGWTDRDTNEFQTKFRSAGRNRQLPALPLPKRKPQKRKTKPLITRSSHSHSHHPG